MAGLGPVLGLWSGPGLVLFPGPWPRPGRCPGPGPRLGPWPGPGPRWSCPWSGPGPRWGPGPGPGPRPGPGLGPGSGPGLGPCFGPSTVLNPVLTLVAGNAVFPVYLVWPGSWPGPWSGPRASSGPGPCPGPITCPIPVELFCINAVFWWGRIWVCPLTVGSGCSPRAWCWASILTVSIFNCSFTVSNSPISTSFLSSAIFSNTLLVVLLTLWDFPPIFPEIPLILLIRFLIVCSCCLSGTSTCKFIPSNSLANVVMATFTLCCVVHFSSFVSLSRYSFKANSICCSLINGWWMSTPSSYNRSIMALSSCALSMLILNSKFNLSMLTVGSTSMTLGSNGSLLICCICSLSLLAPKASLLLFAGVEVARGLPKFVPKFTPTFPTVFGLTLGVCGLLVEVSW